MKYPADYWITQLCLTPHPEGGYCSETYESPDRILAPCLPDRYSADRACAKAIYFLVPDGQVSKFHRLKCEEVWCYHFGAPLTLYILEKEGTLRQLVLGPDFEHGEQFQIIVPHNVWFGAKVNKKDAYTLVSCVTAPGFDFEDFELAERQILLHQYPQHQRLIDKLT